MSNYPVKFDVEYPEKMSRGLLLLRTFLGFFYVLLPHGLCLAVYGFAVVFVYIIAWFAILINGTFPRDLFNFVVGYHRWYARLNAYMSFLTDAYPPFSGKE